MRAEATCYAATHARIRAGLGSAADIDAGSTSPCVATSSHEPARTTECRAPRTGATRASRACVSASRCTEGRVAGKTDTPALDCTEGGSASKACAPDRTESRVASKAGTPDRTDGCGAATDSKGFFTGLDSAQRAAQVDQGHRHHDEAHAEEPGRRSPGPIP